MDQVVPAAEPAIVGHAGRKGLRFCMTDATGALDLTTLRDYQADISSSVAGSLLQYQQELKLPRLPQRAAMAVAGLTRGDAISITNTRWFVSRSGLKAMLSRAPIILNDFEATAWALQGGGASRDDLRGIEAALPPGREACCLVIGMSSGLGVSVLRRDAAGAVTVLATEAGHAGFAPASREMADVIARMHPGQYPVVTETVLSAPGLAALYQQLARDAGRPGLPVSAEIVTASYRNDPLARQACDMLCRAFWSCAADLVLCYGAWDGVFAVGGVSMALRAVLERADIQSNFAGNGKHVRHLQAVPRRICKIANSELFGAAEALRHHAH